MVGAVDHKIVFLDRATLGVPLRSPNFPHAYVEYDATTVEQAAERLSDATIVIDNKVPLRAATLARLPNLKLIALAATGSDCIDKEFCRDHSIAVSNIRDYADNTVPEHVLALIFALRRNLIAYDRDVRAGRWQKADQFCFIDYPIRDIAGSTMGIIGYGALGRAVATRARALGMTVLIHSRSPVEGAVDLDTLLRQSDVVSLHCPLTDQTRNLIGAAELAKMKNDAILINTARGGLIDATALAEALRNKDIGGAGIDVLAEEPPVGGNPLLRGDLLNLIVTPHIAWASDAAMRVLADQLVGNIEAFVTGAPRNLVPL